MKSLKKNELGLIIGLILIGSLIILFENGLFQPKMPTLIAQEQNLKIKLTKGAREVIIPNGDWIYAIDRTDSLKYYSGKYNALSDSLILLKNKKDTIYVIPANIKTLYHGEKKRGSHYAGKGALVGGLTAAGLGLYALVEGASAGDFFLITGCMSICTAPVGGIGGALVGKSKDAAAVEYPLTGSEAWILSIN
jgi:hypothetical protein